MGKAEVDATVRANRFIGPAGVVATACMHRGADATREAQAVISSWDQLVAGES